MGVHWNEVEAAVFKHFGATLTVNTNTTQGYSQFLIVASFLVQIILNSSTTTLSSNSFFLDPAFGFGLAAAFVISVGFLLAFTILNILRLKQPLSDSIVYEAGHLELSSPSMDLYVYAFVYRLNFYLSGPLLLGIGINHAVFGYPLIQEYLPKEDLVLVWVLVAAGFISLLMNLIYLVFLETYLPTKAWESSSSRFTSWFVGLNLLASTILNGTSVYLTRQMIGGAQVANIQVVIWVFRVLLPLGSICFNVYSAVYFQPSSLQVVNSLYWVVALSASYQHLKYYTGVGPAASAISLIGGLGLRLVLNLGQSEILKLGKSQIRKLSLEEMLKICQTCCLSKERGDVDNPYGLQSESYISVFEEQNPGVLSDMAASSFRGDKKITLITCLLTYLDRYDQEKNFYSNAYCLYYLARIRFDLHRVALLLNKLRSSPKDFLQSYTFFLLESFVQENLQQYYMRKEMSDLEKRDFYDASSLSLRESSRSLTPRDATGRSKLWIGDEVISYKFVRSIIMYEKFVKNMITVTEMISIYYDRLTQPRAKIDTIHNSVKAITKQKEKCDKLYDQICEALEHQRLAGFHLLPYAKFLSDMFNEHEQSYSILKKWRQVAKYRFQTMKDAGEIETQTQSVIMLVDTQQKSQSSILYATHNSLQLLKASHQSLVGISINELLGKDLQDAHQIKINELNRNIFDLDYLNRSQERFITIPTLKPIYSRCIVAVDFIPSITAGIRYITSFKNLRRNERDSYLVLNKSHQIIGIGQGLVNHSIFSSMHEFLGQHIKSVDQSLANLMNKYRKSAPSLPRTASDSQDDIVKPIQKPDMSLVLPGPDTNKGVVIAPLGLDPERRTMTRDLLHSKTLERNIQEIPLTFETSPGVYKEIVVSSWVESASIRLSETEGPAEFYLFINVATEDIDNEEPQAAMQSPRILDQIDQEQSPEHSVNPPVTTKEKLDWQMSLDGGSKSGRISKKFTKGASQSSKHQSGVVELFKSAKMTLNKDHHMVGKGLAQLVGGKKGSRLVGYKEVDKHTNSAHHEAVDVASISSAASTVHKKSIRTLFSSVRNKKIAIKETLVIILIQLCFLGISITITSLISYLFDDVMGGLILSRKISRPSYWMGLDAKELGNNLLERMLRAKGLIGSTQDRFVGKAKLTTGIVPTYEQEFENRKKRLQGIVLKWLSNRLSLTWRDGAKFFLYTDSYATRYSSNSSNNVTLQFDTEGLITLLMTYVNIWQKDFLAGYSGFDSYYVNDYATLSWAKWDNTNSKLISAILVLDSNNFSALNSSLYTWIAAGVGISTLLALAMLLTLFFIRRKILGIYSIFNRLNGYEISYKKETLLRFKEVLDSTTDLVERTPIDFVFPPADLRQIKTIQRRSTPKSTLFTCFGMLSVVFSSFVLMQIVNVFGFMTVQTLSNRSQDKLNSMYILRIHQRFVVCSANSDNKAFMVVLNKAGLKKQSVNLTTDLTVIKNCGTELDTNINIITNYSSQRRYSDQDSQFAMDQLYAKPSDNINWSSVGMTQDEVDRLGGSNMGRDYIGLHRWQVLNLQSIYNDLVKLGNGTAALKYFDDPTYLEFAFITRHFITDLVWSFQTKFYQNMDIVFATDHAIISQFTAVEITCFVLLAIAVIFGLVQVSRQAKTAINSLSLLPVDSCFNNMQVRSQMMIVENS